MSFLLLAFELYVSISPMMESHLVKQCFTLSRHLLRRTDHRHLTAAAAAVAPPPPPPLYYK